MGISFPLAEQLPKFEFVSNARPSLFAYQPATKPPEKEVVEKVKTAVLSTTAKTTARAKAKEADQKGDDEMQTVSLYAADFTEALLTCACCSDRTTKRRTSRKRRARSRRRTPK